jgi:hypothetical protein
VAWAELSLAVPEESTALQAAGKIMVTISLMGQLQTADGERDVACEMASPMTVRQLIQRQGVQLRHLLQLIREKKVLVTINKKIASDDSLVHDGDAIRLVGHDGFGGSGLGPTHT